MAYITEKFISLDKRIIIQKKYHSHFAMPESSKVRKKRLPKEKPTEEQQKKINERLRAEKYVRILADNFFQGDYYITFTTKEKMTPEEFKLEMKRFMDRLRKEVMKRTGEKPKFFKALENLDRKLVYVLPVTVRTADIDLLSSAKNYYYVFKAGALINVVADIERNWLQVYPWSVSTIDRVRGIRQITMEALLYPREFGKLISTVMGIEGAFLMRIGDAGVPDNQLQIATSSGNFTDSKLQLQTNQWQHVAMTFDRDTREMKVYINGHLMAETTSNASINIVGNGSDRNFLVGKSYDDARWFSGNISEVRVWDVIRTPEQIASSIYMVDPATEGLIAYWKFDDQSAYVVKDYTGNGNDLKANSALSWKNVSLPAAE
jgi:hypothetical protein